MKKKLLIIEKSSLLGLFLKNKLSNYGIEVMIAKTGFDGLIKMRNEMPDTIILDYNLPKMNIDEFLKEKNSLKTTKDIPIILLYSKNNSFDKQTILNFAKYKLYKLILKPVEIDQLLNILENIYMRKFDIDLSKSFIDIHLNGDFLFVEISKGINLDKLELVKYRILEIKQRSVIKKIIIIMTNIEYHNSMSYKLDLFMKSILLPSGLATANVNLLTNIAQIKNYYLTHPKYKYVEILKDVDIVNDKIRSFNEDFTESNDLINDYQEPNMDFKFNDEKIKVEKKYAISNMKNENEMFNIAVIDDDLRILEFMEILLSKKDWKINTYVDGALFIESLEKKKPDLIFLDLMLPSMSGFDVLEYLYIKNINIPIIIVSALYNKDLLLKANKFGVSNFLVKPLKPDVILKRSEEFYFRKIFNKNEMTVNNDDNDVNKEIFVS